MSCDEMYGIFFAHKYRKHHIPRKRVNAFGCLHCKYETYFYYFVTKFVHVAKPLPNVDWIVKGRSIFLANNVDTDTLAKQVAPGYHMGKD